MTITNVPYQIDLPENFHPSSKVWIFQSIEPLTAVQQSMFKKEATTFAETWHAHEVAVTSHFAVLLNHFIVVLVDEHNHAMSGCGIDKLFRWIQNIENSLHLNIFNRESIAYMENNKITCTKLNDLIDRYQQGYLSDETLFFNNIISTKQELETNWLQPIGNSWIKKKADLLKKTTV
ncbi:MAG: hypothetical protein QM528_05665 [Phycisphaerales bacterium]|nr:hypothetical protein [Phycisphaerales bacterium]